MTSTNDPIRAYGEARQALEVATSVCERYSNFLQGVGTAMRDWKRVMFDNSIGFPAEVALARSAPSIDAKAWPTALDVAQALVDWHARQSDLRNAWSRVPEADRAMLKPPGA